MSSEEICTVNEGKGDGIRPFGGAGSHEHSAVGLRIVLEARELQLRRSIRLRHVK